jgi:hypothetical protein
MFTILQLLQRPIGVYGIPPRHEETVLCEVTGHASSTFNTRLNKSENAVIQYKMICFDQCSFLKESLLFTIEI